MENKKLSIITPIYNPPINLFKKFLKSIQENSYQDFECILIYDYYNEEIQKMLEKIEKEDNRFKVIYNTTRLATFTNRFIGVENSTGYYLSFVDSDDSVDKDYFQSLINQLE
jgi:glycosyltransferase involved in cell wall biosynthesis